MAGRIVIWFIVVLSLVFVLSCARLEEEQVSESPSLGTQPLPAPDSVPLEWGKMVSVTTTPVYREWFQLWFQDESGQVRIVAYNVVTRQLHPNCRLIPRK